MVFVGDKGASTYHNINTAITQYNNTKKIIINFEEKWFSYAFDINMINMHLILVGSITEIDRYENYEYWKI